MAVGSTLPLNRNEYQGYLLGGKGGWWVELTTFPPSCPDYLEISDALTCWNPRALPGLHMYCFTFIFTFFTGLDSREIGILISKI
jgi:hypothetical protein